MCDSGRVFAKGSNGAGRVPGVKGSGAAKEDFGFARKENLGEIQPKRDG